MQHCRLNDHSQVIDQGALGETAEPQHGLAFRCASPPAAGDCQWLDRVTAEFRGSGCARRQVPFAVRTGGLRCSARFPQSRGQKVATRKLRGDAGREQHRAVLCILWQAHVPAKHAAGNRPSLINSRRCSCGLSPLRRTSPLTAAPALPAGRSADRPLSPGIP